MSLSPPVVISLDGVIVDPERAVISVLDRGLLYGEGCFEVMRTWSRQPVELGAHLDRLLEAARWLALAAPSRVQLAASVRDALDAAGGSGELRVRVVLTRGPGSLDAPAQELGPGRSIVIVDPLPAQPTVLSLAVVDWPLPSRRAPGHKALAYLDHLVARGLARDAGADEAVRLDAGGNVAEGATCNLFVALRGVVMTPSTGTGARAGVVRERVLSLCARLGISAKVHELSVADMRQAEEVFATSSLRGVVPAMLVGTAPRHGGPIAARIAAEYVRAMHALAAGVAL